MRIHYLYVFYISDSHHTHNKAQHPYDYLSRAHEAPPKWQIHIVYSIKRICFKIRKINSEYLFNWSRFKKCPESLV